MPFLGAIYLEGLWFSWWWQDVAVQLDVSVRKKNFVQLPVLWARPVMWECPTVKLYTLLQIYNYYIRTTIQMLGGSLRDTVVWQSGHWLTMEKELFLVFTLWQTLGLWEWSWPWGWIWNLGNGASSLKIQKSQEPRNIHSSNFSNKLNAMRCKKFYGKCSMVLLSSANWITLCSV